MQNYTLYIKVKSQKVCAVKRLLSASYPSAHLILTILREYGGTSSNTRFPSGESSCSTG